jgi:hypothetical protein
MLAFLEARIMGTFFRHPISDCIQTKPTAYTRIQRGDNVRLDRDAANAAGTRGVKPGTVENRRELVFVAARHQRGRALAH